jgi:hypothetical protein
MKISIISSINVAKLVDALKASPTRAANLKQKVYYFLSLITDTNETYRLNSGNHGYHNLCSTELKKIMGNRDFYIIREMLLNPIDPIIEIDNSWHNPSGNKRSGFCQGYRITSKYNNGEVAFKTLTGRFAKNVWKYQHKTSVDKKDTPNYQFLLNQFNYHNLKFDPRIYQFIFNTGIELKRNIKNNNPYQTNLVNNHIGRWLYYVNQFQIGTPWHTVSHKNHRLNSSLTSLPRQLRPFLLCNDEPMLCIDVSSSQPYILSSIMKSNFYYEHDIGYNLKTTYSELYEILVDNGNIDNSITYSSNTGIQYYTSYTGYTTNYYSNNTNNYSSFMWCSFFNAAEIDSLNRYIEAPFYLDFYTHLLDRYYTFTNTIKTAAKNDERDNLKNTMMFVLFDENQNHRNNNHQIQIFQTVYPGVERWINQIHRMIGKQRFSYLLQRAESYLLLNVICREFNEQTPTAPLFTIHDGIFTTSKYVQKLNGFVLRRLNELTGVLAGCKTKTSQIDPNPQMHDVEKEWDKIKPINTEKKYLKNINGVFTSNITRGSDFLENFGRHFLNGIDDQI